jgi:hypothetical protein
VLRASLAAVASWAIYPESTPGNARGLGIELDPTLSYDTPFGFGAALEQATLFPLAGLDNPRADLAARIAQLWRVRLMYRF